MKKKIIKINNDNNKITFIYFIIRLFLFYGKGLLNKHICKYILFSYNFNIESLNMTIINQYLSFLSSDINSLSRDYYLI